MTVANIGEWEADRLLAMVYYHVIPGELSLADLAKAGAAETYLDQLTSGGEMLNFSAAGSQARHAGRTSQFPVAVRKALLSASTCGAIWRRSSGCHASPLKRRPSLSDPEDTCDRPAVACTAGGSVGSSPEQQRCCAKRNAGLSLLRGARHRHGAAAGAHPGRDSTLVRYQCALET